MPALSDPKCSQILTKLMDWPIIPHLKGDWDAMADRCGVTGRSIWGNPIGRCSLKHFLATNQDRLHLSYRVANRTRSESHCTARSTVRVYIHITHRVHAWMSSSHEMKGNGQ
jgi:hypothetical protein